MQRTRIGIALTAGALALTGLAGYGIGSAGTGQAATLVSKATTGSAQESPEANGFDLQAVADAAGVTDWRGLLQRFGARPTLLHGEVTVRTEKQGDKVVTVQRGTVRTYAGDALTVASPDGYTQTWNVSGDTRVIKNREKVDLSTLTPGTTVIVAGAKDGDRHPARLVVIPKA